ncbi:MAG: hypothetical protein A3J67_05740 [Parcubacteria group bacterium RIFCSPHIGHO2_02_FULL_48_10b]|nr:MAG: hypothetical protein A3J67_05740 [Parcubacteria group bacterium RIFCSPHIGHO2_02_FULL_48_10b]
MSISKLWINKIGKTILSLSQADKMNLRAARPRGIKRNSSLGLFSPEGFTVEGTEDLGTNVRGNPSIRSINSGSF